jgi:hypothetical protein
MALDLTIGHWLPIVTFCPVNGLPDLIYVYVRFEVFKELYSVRKRIYQLLYWRTMYMEEIGETLLNEFQDASSVKVKLLTGRHIVTIRRNKHAQS